MRGPVTRGAVVSALERLLDDMEAPRSRKATEAWDHAHAILKRARDEGIL